MSNLGYNKYHTHITAKKKLFDFNLSEVWKYKYLIILFMKKSFKLVYKQTILGPLWIILQPIISSAMYTVVFGKIAGLSSDGVPQLLFYLSASSIWSVFSSTITHNADTFINNASLFSKVYFPRLIMPLSTALSSIINFFAQFIVIFILLLYYVSKGAVYPTLSAIFMIPIILIQLSLLGLGFGIIVSSMTTRYRDLKLIVGFGVSLWMYITPVVYPLSQIDNELLKKIVMFNPVSMPIEMFRYFLFGVGQPNYVYYAISWFITIIVLLIGISIFNKVEKTFVDVV